MDESADVAVVGGGLAGLAAAAYLARAGRSVVVLERSAMIGGRAITQRKDGFHFNLGPHALYRGGQAAAVLRELGIAFTGAVPPARGLAFRGGVPYALPLGPLSLLGTRLLGLGAKLEAARLLASIERLDLQGLGRIALREWLAGTVSHAEVRDLVAAIVRLTTYANDPALMSAAAALRQLQLAQQGVLYLDGGWQTLVDGLARAAEAAGVRILTRASVAAIDRDGPPRAVRLTDGTTWRASAVIVAASPAVACALVEQGSRTPLGRWAESAAPVRVACLDVALTRLPRPRALFALGIDEPVYVSVHSATARLAPPGEALLHAARYLEATPPDPAAVERGLEQAIEALQPGWRGLVRHRRFLREMVVAHALPTARGGGIAGRPGPEVPGWPGLFVAGDWVGREGLLSDAALASARAAAAAVVAADGRGIAAA